MKMESFSKHPYGVVSNSGSAPSSGGSFYDSAHFSANTIFVEFEDDSREMGVDVPDSFVAQTKTPPKYPPPQPLTTAHPLSAPHNRVYSVTLGSDDVRRGNSNNSSLSNGHSPKPGMGLPSRDHLRIEKDGRLINTMEAPPLPTPQQSQRIKKYSEEISKRQAEQVRYDLYSFLMILEVLNCEEMSMNK